MSEASASAIVESVRHPVSFGPLSWLKSAWHSRVLILRLTRREIESRYRGSFLGVLWSFVVPILLLAVYTFVFSVVFQARWDVPVGNRGHFALILFAGLIVFNLFGDCINRAPGLMLANPAYIKRVVFPLEILPWVAVLSAVFNALLSFIVLALAYALLLGVPPWTVLLFPVLLIPHLLLIIGFTLFLSSVGVFIRDLQQIIGVVTMMLMFLTPLFYPASAIPEALRPYIAYSPLALVVEGERGVLFWGALPEWPVWSIYFAISWAVAWLGYVWFMKTKKGFADVV